MTKSIRSGNAASCDTSLVLLLDESQSIADRDWLKQVHATADAIEHPDIVEIFTRKGGVALAVDSFDDAVQRRLDWTVVRTQEEANAFASRLREMAGSQKQGTTDIGSALDHALDSFGGTPCQRVKDIIDISTDATNNGSPYARIMLERARKRAVAEGVVINGIGVDGYSHGEEVLRLLKENIITPTGFAQGTSWNDYGEEIYKKLREELTAHVPEKPMVPDISRKAAMLGHGQ